MNLLASARSWHKSARALWDHRIEIPWRPPCCWGSDFESAGPQPSKLKQFLWAGSLRLGKEVNQVENIGRIRSCSPFPWGEGQIVQSDCVVVMLFFIIELALNVTTVCPGIRISAPVVGSRPLRGRFVRTRNLPKPEIFTGSPLSRKALMISKGCPRQD